MAAILDELIEYANNCINDVRVSEFEDYISCTAHKWTCRRFLTDVDRSQAADTPFHWSEADAQKIVDWFALLRHSKGILAGKPIDLTPWQKFFMCQIYGWRRPDGTRRFRKSFTEIARKNAKSQMQAGVALYEISVTATANGEIAEAYTAGTKRQQSAIVFSEAKLMLRGSPLATKFRITRDAVTHIKSGSTIRPLSKEDGKTGDGTNPALLVLDEYHQHPSTDLYDLALGSQTREPLLMIITTAGRDLNVPCYTQEYQYCKKLLNPDIPDVQNDEYFADIMELDPADYADLSRLDDRRIWWKANPIRMSYPEGVEKIAADYEIAQQQPEKMTSFLTKMMDIWVQAREDGYMDMAKWRACEVESIPYDLRGYPVYVGLDMSAKIDLTSVAFIIPVLDGKTTKYVLFSHSFIPNRQKMMERKSSDRFDYDMCERLGFLTVTDTPIVDQEAVMQYVLDTCKQNDWHIECLCFDPANASKIMMDLSNEGYDVEEVFQSHRSLNESTQGFREQVYAGNVVFTHNPLLTFAMGNAVIRTNNGLIKIDKDMTRLRIDPVDATLCAFKLAMYHDIERQSDLDDIDAFLADDTW